MLHAQPHIPLLLLPQLHRQVLIQIHIRPVVIDAVVRVRESPPVRFLRTDPIADEKVEERGGVLVVSSEKLAGVC